jgi:phosphate transport system substrate-binding protein
VANPYTTWKQVNPQLPDTTIEVLGPPPTSGTRDAFAELAMEGGCSTFPAIAELKSKDEAAYKALCQSMREDGKYIEAGENDNLIVQKLEANPKALGIFGYSFLEQNEDKVQGSFVDGVEPSFKSIADGSYAVSRPLFFYVK